MPAKAKSRIRNFKTLLTAVVLTVAVVGAGFYSGIARADKFDVQIDNLKDQNASYQSQVDELTSQADSYQDAINKLEAQINGLQQQIVANQKASDKLAAEIKQKEAELAHQKDVLGENIKQMYLEGQISTLEILAASRDISDFVNKEVSRSIVQNKIKTLVDQIAQLKLSLEQKQRELEARIKDQKNQQAELNAAQDEQSRLLSYTVDQKAAFNSKISKNKNKIADLYRQQALENIRRFGGSGGQIGGGGYPWGYAKCIHTGQVDGWCPNYDWAENGSVYNWNTGGYGFRNCTDWVAWRVRTNGGFVPSGLGNARQWDDRAPGYGYTVSSTPRQGAAAVSNYGYYGHVMFVEKVNGDGTITVSDYNRAGTGKYDVNVINPSGLVFVYF
ncbi:MAG TPA: CHAP domain-containing protein [Candidatus Saccharimonadales bacterium]|nr:CHAP domain-containing protein [Candidatus Saccharimonadales bacterium]